MLLYKRLLLLFFLLFTLIQHNSAQIPVTDKEEKITEINIAYRQINANIKSYKVTEKDSEGRSAEGGKIRIYRSKGNIVKAAGIYYGETGQQLTEYYFRGGNLIFVHDKDSEYDKPGYISGSKITKVTEGNYYFDNGKIIRWVDKKGRIKPEKDFAEKEGQILAGLSEIK